MIYGEPGKFFYHYTTADTAFRYILPSGTLRLSPYSTMRDPLEAKEWHLGGVGWGEIEQEFYATYSLAQKAKQCSKLLSLSVDTPAADEESSFGRGYALASMWELYGAAHAGVCLVFDRATLTSSFETHLAEHGHAFHQRVLYTRAGMSDDPDAKTLMLGGGGTVEEKINAHLRAHRTTLFFTKLSDWEHESEYRFVLLSDNTEPLTCTYGDALRAVIVGHLFPDWQVPSALALCTRTGTEAKRLIWEMSRPIVVSLRSDGGANP